MKIAFFTPLPPMQSAISDIGEGLGLAFSAMGVAVDYVIDDDYTPDSRAVLVDSASVVNYHDFGSRALTYDAILYSLGNHPRYHGYMYGPLLHNPGWVMLHDLALHPYVAAMTLGRGHWEAYLDEVDYAYGFRDLRIAKLMETPLADQWALAYPMFERFVDMNLGVMVHNAYAAAAITQRRGDANVTRIPSPFFLPPGVSETKSVALRHEHRAALGIGEQDLVVGSFGILVPDKHIEACLRAFKRVLAVRPDAHYILGGSLIEGYDLPGFIAAEGLSDHVHLTGWMPPQQFAEMMFALDIAVHLRYPHIGGTPYTPVRLMGVGVCTIVSDIEPLAEFPQGTCVKIPIGVHQEDSLIAVMVHLAQNPALAEQIADNGRQFIAAHHDVHTIAEQYLRFMSGGTGAWSSTKGASNGRS